MKKVLIFAGIMLAVVFVVALMLAISCGMFIFMSNFEAYVCAKGWIPPIECWEYE